LARFLIGEKRDQSFKLSCRLVRLVSLFQHQLLKFPECLIVIHVSLLLSKPMMRRGVVPGLSVLFCTSNAQIFPPLLIDLPDRPITPDVLRRNNWTMVSAIRSYRGIVEHGPCDFVPICRIHTLVLVDTFVQ
jgi:hypothetical protein